MILMADFMHNILDGLAIGVAFSTPSAVTAVSTVIAIVAHEIPQEIGNLGILINAGFGVKAAICWNGLINMSGLIGIYFGFIFGALSVEMEKIGLGFIAGNFLYIGLTSMLPVLLKQNQEKGNSSLNISQLLAFIAGLGMMVVLTNYE